jgi:hypothetical protein
MQAVTIVLVGAAIAVRGSAERLSSEIDDLHNREQQRTVQLQARRTRPETTERNPQPEPRMNGRLHQLISQARK